jgi:hypothetical protein
MTSACSTPNATSFAFIGNFRGTVKSGILVWKTIFQSKPTLRLKKIILCREQEKILGAL